MVIRRDTEFWFDHLSAGTSYAEVSELFPADSGRTGGTNVSTYATGAAANFTWRPSSNGSPASQTGAPTSFRGIGWAIPLSKFSPVSSPGRVRMPAQTLEFQIPCTSTASNALTLTTPQYTPRASVWAIDPTGIGTAVLLADATGDPVQTRGLGAPSNPKAYVYVPVSQYDFPEGWLFYVQLGGLVTAPQPALGSSTETYTFNASGGGVMYADQPFRAAYERAGSSGVVVPSLGVSRRVGYHRLPVAPAAGGEGLASRLLSCGRAAQGAADVAAQAVRSATFPRGSASSVPVSVSEAIRQATFRRPTIQALESIADSARRVTALRRLVQEGNDPDVSATKRVTYGRRTSYYHQPSEEPVIDPTREIRVNVLNADGTPHGAGAYVVLFRSDNNLAVQSAVTDASSQVAFPRNSFDSFRYFVAAWDEDGVPLGQAVSERTLEPELVG